MDGLLELIDPVTWIINLIEFARSLSWFEIWLLFSAYCLMRITQNTSSIASNIRKCETHLFHLQTATYEEEEWLNKHDEIGGEFKSL